MAAKIRLRKVGKKNRPYYRVVVIDESAPRDGREIEIVGSYAPVEEKDRFNFDGEKILAWIKKGATPSEKMRILLGEAGILPKVSFEGRPKRKPRSEEKKEKAEAAAPKEEAKAEEKAEEKKEKPKEEGKEEAKAEKKEEKPKEEKAEAKSEEKPVEEVKKEVKAEPKAEQKKEEKPAEKKEEAPKQ